MLARMMNSNSPVNPPGNEGISRPWKTPPQPGTVGDFIAQNAAGTYTRLNAQKNRVSFSNVQYWPVMETATRIPVTAK